MRGQGQGQHQLLLRLSKLAEFGLSRICNRFALHRTELATKAAASALRLNDDRCGSRADSKALRAVYLFHVRYGFKRTMIALEGLRPDCTVHGIRVFVRPRLCHHYYGTLFLGMIELGFGRGGRGFRNFLFSFFPFLRLPFLSFVFFFLLDFPSFRFSDVRFHNILDFALILPFAYFCHLHVLCKSI